MKIMTVLTVVTVLTIIPMAGCADMTTVNTDADISTLLNIYDRDNDLALNHFEADVAIHDFQFLLLTDAQNAQLVAYLGYEPERPVCWQSERPIVPVVPDEPRDEFVLIKGRGNVVSGVRAERLKVIGRDNFVMSDVSETAIVQGYANAVLITGGNVNVVKVKGMHNLVVTDTDMLRVQGCLNQVFVTNVDISKITFIGKHNRVYVPDGADPTVKYKAGFDNEVVTH